MSSKSYGSDVRVSKAGGVPEMDVATVLYPDPAEVGSLIQQQHQSIEALAKDRDAQLRAANFQEQLESEAKQLLVQNAQRLQQARDAVKMAENELTLGMEKERQFELKRAVAHDEVQKREHERAQAKAAEVLLMEEIKETEKIARAHENNKLIALTAAKARDIDIREAELKIQSIQLRSQVPVTAMQPSQPSPVKIEVEVGARTIPEQRIFSEKNLEGVSTIAAAEIKEKVPSDSFRQQKARKPEVISLEKDSGQVEESQKVKRGGFKKKLSSMLRTPEQQ